MSAFIVRRAIPAGATALAALALAFGGAPAYATGGGGGGNDECELKGVTIEDGRGDGAGGGRCFNPGWANDGIEEDDSRPGGR